MSEYEKINAGVKNSMAERRKKAVKRIVLVILGVLLALAAFVGLKLIHFISLDFMVILMAVAVCTGAFKIGYVSAGIKF